MRDSKIATAPIAQSEQRVDNSVHLCTREEGFDDSPDFLKCLMQLRKSILHLSLSQYWQNSSSGRTSVLTTATSVTTPAKLLL